MKPDGGIYIKSLIKQLNELPKCLRERATITHKITTPLWKQMQIEAEEYVPKTLSEVKAGEVVREVMRLFGKPKMNYVRPYWSGVNSGEPTLGYRKVVWQWKPAELPKNLRRKDVHTIVDKMEKKKLLMKTTLFWSIVVHIPESCYVSSFYNSKSPRVWKKNHKKIQQKIENMRKKKEVMKRLDGMSNGKGNI